MYSSLDETHYWLPSAYYTHNTMTQNRTPRVSITMSSFEYPHTRRVSKQTRIVSKRVTLGKYLAGLNEIHLYSNNKGQINGSGSTASAALLCVPLERGGSGVRGRSQAYYLERVQRAHVGLFHAPGRRVGEPPHLQHAGYALEEGLGIHQPPGEMTDRRLHTRT